MPTERDKLLRNLSTEAVVRWENDNLNTVVHNHDNYKVHRNYKTRKFTKRNPGGKFTRAKKQK